MQLKILSWNIWIDGDFKQVSEFIKQVNPDVIGLQEVKDDDVDFDIIGYLTGLGYDYVFAPVRHIWGDKVYMDGPAIFSKYPIVKKETYILSDIDPRGAVRADVKVGNTILHVFNTHLVHTHQKQTELQDIQLENLIKKLTPKRTILTGDFNATPASNVIEKVKEILVDTDIKSLPTWSLDTKGCPICKVQTVDIKLDYIFVSKDLKHMSFKVLEGMGSDHTPVSVMVEV
jgi:endonuclease/exonuclease/phosphatase family metal-dependent hydrolase